MSDGSTSLTVPASMRLLPSEPLQTTTAQPSGLFSVPVRIQPRQLAVCRRSACFTGRRVLLLTVVKVVV